MRAPRAAYAKDSGRRYPYRVPLGLKKPAVPKDNPLTRAKVKLGKLLFFDKRLSRDGSVSCATCHNPKLGWTDQRPTPIGIREQIGSRNAPAQVNAAFQESLFWDGRAHSLEEQAKDPISNPREMDLPLPEAAARIGAIKGYRKYFRAAFGDGPVTIDRIVQAIASFERTILSGDSAYDRYQAGKKKAMAEEALRGMALFSGKANCESCHPGPNFTDGRFHNLGVGMERSAPDWGRQVITGQEGDRGAFKTPSLRNLADTAPYMHDGSQAALRDVIEFFDKGGRGNKWLSPAIKPLGLSEGEKTDLLAFLQSLNGDKVAVEEPRSLPK